MILLYSYSLTIRSVIFCLLFCITLIDNYSRDMKILAIIQDIYVMVESPILLVERSIGVSTSRKSNLGDLGIALGPKSNNLDRYSNLRDLGIALFTRAGIHKRS